MHDRLGEKGSDGDLTPQPSISNIIPLPPNRMQHVSNDNQGNRRAPCPRDSRIQDAPKRVLAKNRGKRGTTKHDNNCSPTATQIPAPKKQMFSTLLLAVTTVAGSGMHSPDPSSMVVEETVVEDSPEANLVPIKGHGSPHLLPKPCPSPNRKLYFPPTIEFRVIFPLGGHNLPPSTVRKHPTL